jgi:phage-related minor tail protein
VAAGAGIAGAAVGAAFSFGIEGAMDIASAQTSLQNQLGLTEVEAQRAGDVAGDVFSRGFGDSMADVTEALGGVHTSIGDLGDFTDAELEEMSASALALSKTFKVDVADATGAVGKLIKTDLVADATEGFDLITKTMQSIPAELRDDVLPTMEEYSTQFRRVGLDGQTSMGLISQALNNGARDADQVADAIGQFGERALAGGTAVDDAYSSIGLSADDMAAKIGKGGKHAEGALQETLDALRGTTDEQTKLNAAAALFGDPANVMGDALFALDPASAAASAGLDNAGGSMQDLIAAMEGDPAQQFDAVMRTVQNTLGELLLPVLIRVGEFFREHQGLIKAAVIPAMIVLAEIFLVLTAATIAWTIALLANPITWIVLGIITLIAIVVLLILKWDWAKQQLGQLWDWIKGKAEAVWGSIKGVIAVVLNAIMGIVRSAIGVIKTVLFDFNPLVIIIRNWGSITGWVSRQWAAITSKVSNAVDRIGGFFSGMWGGITSGLRSALNGAIGLINRAIGGINSLIGGANRLPGVSIPFIPFIPFLAEGGIATGPTLAMVGEGREDEAILPLSRLESMISTVQAPSVSKVQPVTTRVVLDVTGGEDAFVDFFKSIVRNVGNGSVVELGEG